MKDSKKWGFARRAAWSTSALCALASFGVIACGTSDTKPPPHVLASGEIGTWAGTGTQGNNGEGQPRLEAWLDQPMEMAFAPDGTAVIVDWNNHQVRQVGKDGKIETLIGTVMPGDWPCQRPGADGGVPGTCDVPLSGSVPGSSLNLNHPMDVAFDDSGFYVAAWHNHKVEHYDDAAKDVTIVAGMMKPGPVKVEGTPAASTLFNFPSSIVIQADKSLLVSDQRNNRVRRIAPDGTRAVTTVAGSAVDKGTNADGIAATTALLLLAPTDKLEGADNPPPGGALALDAEGNLYIADTFHHAIRKVAAGADGLITGAADEIVTTVAGTLGTSGFTGDGGPATSATLNQPFDIEFAPGGGALVIADTENHAVRRVDLAKGTIETLAGNGKPGFSGDDGPAKAAQLREPYGLAFDSTGDLYVVDTLNNRIRCIAH
jgi:sugar lactone lactonase YvrE